jgi:hypothetical protein
MSGRPGAVLPDPAAALALLKPAVRAQAAYGLEAPAASRKLNQNEAPSDVPEDLKREILRRAGALVELVAAGHTPSGLPGAGSQCAALARGAG